MSKKSWMGKGFYRWNRQLHLYFGIFICPFLLIFAVSTIMLNHRIRFTPEEKVTPVPVSIPEEIVARVNDPEVLAGMSKAEKAVARRALADHLLGAFDLGGEVAAFGFVKKGKTSLGSTRPGQTTRVIVDLVQQEAEVVVQTHNLFETMRYLHLNPGPHRHPVWIGTKIWGWIADATVYLTLFLTLSGIYMWYVLKVERKSGLLFMGAGCVSFCAILYALVIL